MIILALDLSTNSTGYAIFDTSAASLKESLTKADRLTPNVVGISKLTYPKGVLKKCQSLSSQIKDLIGEVNPDKIVIEEINRGISRIGQKGLDGLHFILLDRIEEFLPIIYFLDSDGNLGWRSQSCLDLRLSKNDKTTNARRRNRNKAARAASKRMGLRVAPGTILPIITKKHKAQEFVNLHFGTSYDVDSKKTDSDICDAIGLGVAYIKYILKIKGI